MRFPHFNECMKTISNTLSWYLHAAARVTARHVSSPAVTSVAPTREVAGDEGSVMDRRLHLTVWSPPDERQTGVAARCW